MRIFLNEDFQKKNDRKKTQSFHFKILFWGKRFTVPTYISASQPLSEANINIIKHKFMQNFNLYI